MQNPEKRPGRMRFFIPSSQRYFWSPIWQRGERESLEALNRGDVARFDTVEAAIAWLSEDEDQD